MPIDIATLREAGKCNAGCHPYVCVCALCDEAADEIERLQAHKRAQAEDIMTLGQQVGRLEAEIERLRAELAKHEQSASEFHADICGENDNLKAEIKQLQTWNENAKNHNADLERENARLRAALKETTAEAVEHRKNIIECHTADPNYFSNPAYREAYDKELARMDGVIERARAALEQKLKGEGATDAEALDNIRYDLALASGQPASKEG